MSSTDIAQDHPHSNDTAQTKTPPRPSDTEKPIQSSPYSEGTAGGARHKSEARVDENIKLVQHDLKTTQRVPFVSMLKAMLMMKRSIEDRSPGEVLSQEELEAHGATALHDLLTASVEFCNSENRSEKLKSTISSMLMKSQENQRYHSLASGLNSILMDFQGGTVESALFAVNDPSIIVSEALSEMGSATKLKPDVCLVKYQSLLKLAPGLEHSSIQSFAIMMEDDPKLLSVSAREIPDSDKRRWSDVISCIELKKLLVWKDRPERFGRPYDVKTMTDSKAPLPIQVVQPEARSVDSRTAEPSAKPAQSGPKRRSEGEPGGPSKKTRTIDSAPAQIASVNNQKPRIQLTPDTQCAFYGIELLRSRWDKTHSIVFLLIDNRLSLRWYDSQGCIATSEVDIIDYLPLLVAVTVLLQSFKGPMRGLPEVDLKAIIDGEEVAFAVPDDTPTRWEMKGRRPVTGFPVTKKSTSDAASVRPSLSTRATRANQPPAEVAEAPEDTGRLSNLFFKWSWREETRDSENFIIATAKERAQRYLPTDHVGDILNHLPDVKYGQELELYSTGQIRKFAGIDTTGSRIPNILLSKRLRPIDGIDGETLKVKIWDVIRCFWLLWAIGVAHGDISYWNIMFDHHTNKLILNDFDLATLMEPGDRSPAKKGFERTGTKPFMAVQLMENIAGTLQRIRKHDLESFIWFFAWICEGDRSRLRWQWNDVDFSFAAGRKGNYWQYCFVRTEPPKTIKASDECLWKAVCSVVTNWMLLRAQEAAQERSLPDVEFLKPFDTAFPRAEEYKTWDWFVFAVPPLSRN